VPIIRSQIAFALGACGGLSRILEYARRHPDLAAEFARHAFGQV
jgi:hypothetical protein